MINPINGPNKKEYQKDALDPIFLFAPIFEIKCANTKLINTHSAKIGSNRVITSLLTIVLGTSLHRS
jgi:hypothetical protein